MNTLETMPAWAQDIVVEKALGLLEIDDVQWEYFSEDYISVFANGFTYCISSIEGTIR